MPYLFQGQIEAVFPVHGASEHLHDGDSAGSDAQRTVPVRSVGEGTTGKYLGCLDDLNYHCSMIFH